MTNAAWHARGGASAKLGAARLLANSSAMREEAGGDPAPRRRVIRGYARRGGRLSAVDTRGGCVLELLLGAEESVEHGLAGALAEDQGHGGADQAEQDDPTEAALLVLLRRPEGLGGVAQVLRGDLEVALHLLVAGHGLDRAAVAGRTAVGALSCLEGLLEAVAQFFVLDQTLHVGILACGRIKIGGLGRLGLGHAFSSLDSPGHSE